jgi:hypothetical protein
MIFKPDVNINKLYIEARIKRHLSDYGEEIGYIVLYCLDVDSIISVDINMGHVEFKLVKINEYSKQDLNIPQLNLLKQSCQYFRNTSLNLFISNDQKNLYITKFKTDTKKYKEGHLLIKSQPNLGA